MLKWNIEPSKIWYIEIFFSVVIDVDYNKYDKVIYKRPINKYFLLILIISLFILMNP